MASRVLLNKENKITQGYSASHKAVDLARSIIIGAKIIAHSAGTVVFCQTGHKNNKNAVGNASYGNCVKIDHGGGWATLYAHLSRVDVKLGDRVQQGQVIGVAGNTGRSFGTHLHFEVRKNNTRIDPTPYLEADLPAAVPQVTYQAHAGKWWARITDCHDKSTTGYAGVTGRKLTALKAEADTGSLRLRVHTVGGGWQPWVTDFAQAGDGVTPIDAVQAQLVGAAGWEVQYRVSVAGQKKWYSWYRGLRDSHGGGWAGVMGRPIDRIQMKVVEV